MKPDDFTVESNQTISPGERASWRASTTDPALFTLLGRYEYTLGTVEGKLARALAMLRGLQYLASRAPSPAGGPGVYGPSQFEIISDFLAEP